MAKRVIKRSKQIKKENKQKKIARHQRVCEWCEEFHEIDLDMLLDESMSPEGAAAFLKCLGPQLDRFARAMLLRDPRFGKVAKKVRNFV